MNILCKLFGHKSSEHDYSGGEYMRLARGAIDGIGREHATLYARCPRCEKKYRAGQIHLIQRECDRVAISAQADACDDSALLDAMELQRIAVMPEYEGPWDAEVYNGDEKPNQRGTGSTPRDAIRAAISAAQGSDQS